MQSLPQENFQEPEEDLEYLAPKVAHYPAKSLATLFQLLSREFQEHAKKDRLRGRPLRSSTLKSASDSLSTSGKYLLSSSTSPFSAKEISPQEISYQAYTLSRYRYGRLAEFFTEMEKKLQEQRQYIVAGYLNEVRDRLLIAEKISPLEQKWEEFL